MRIYISSAKEDLPVARQLADLLARHPSVASTGDTTIYNPFDDPDLVGKSERDMLAAREAKMAESNFIILLLSQTAMSSPEVWRDIDQVRLLRESGAVKFFLIVQLSPFDFDEPLASIISINAVRRPIDTIVGAVAYYTTWRPRQTGGRTIFTAPPYSPQPPIDDDAHAIEPHEPPRPAPQAPPQPILPPEPGAAPAAASSPPFSPPPQPPAPGYAPPAPQGAPAGAPPPAPFGAPPPATRAAPPSTSTLQFSAYHPNTLAVETWNTLLIYTYIAETLAQIQADAATFTELGSAPTVAQGHATRAVARGVELTIEPHMEGVTFSPTSDSFVWREDWRRSLFRFSGAATLAGREQRGWIDIYAGPMVPIARIDITFPFHESRPQQFATNPPRGMIVTSNIYDAVFISYSHRDGEAFHQACEEYRRFGITIYTDEQLESGAQYERELSGMIAAAKIFHLLWSRNSAGSSECRKEWLSALQREPSERFIKPWFWKQPLTPPPAEFVQHRISFKYEPLKRSLWRPETWFQ